MLQLRNELTTKLHKPVLSAVRTQQTRHEAAKSQRLLRSNKLHLPTCYYSLVEAYHVLEQ